MKKDLLQQHFRNSGFDDMESDALAAVFDEMATKSDLNLLRAELRGDMAGLRTELKGDMTSLRNEMVSGFKDLRTEMATLKADLTWRFVALTAFLGAVMTLLGVFAV